MSDHDHDHGHGQEHDHDDRDTYYRNDILLTEIGHLLPADLEGVAGVLEADVLKRELGIEDPESVDAGAIDRLLQEGVTAYSVLPGFDPREIAIAALEEVGAQVSPVLVSTVTNHWTFAPWGAPSPYPQAANQPAPTPPLNSDFTGAQTVAVVDTGYDNAGSPPWLQLRAQPADPAIDAESTAIPKAVAGHGRFVASLIAQQNPAVAIRVAAMKSVSDRKVFGNLPPSFYAGFSSDELQLLLAINRLLLTFNGGYSALNLSLGSYGAIPLDHAGVAIRRAIDWWMGQTGSPVFAAAGNHAPPNPTDPPPPPFLPAAFGDVESVQSVNEPNPKAGVKTLSDFSNPGNVSALGKGVVGVRDSSGWVSWSGTSFATAIVTGEYSRTGPVGNAVDVAPTIKHL